MYTQITGTHQSLTTLSLCSTVHERDSFSHHDDVTDIAVRFVSCSEVQQGTLDKVFWRQSHHVGLLKRRHSSGDPERSHRLKPKEVITEGGSGLEGGGASGGT